LLFSFSLYSVYPLDLLFWNLWPLLRRQGSCLNQSSPLILAMVPSLLWVLNQEVPVLTPSCQVHSTQHILSFVTICPPLASCVA
jgi:hypothetical protein